MKRILSLLLAALMVGSFAACGQKETTAQSDNAQATAAETEKSNVDANGFLLDDLPAALTYNGATFNILIGNYMEAYRDDIYSEGETGELFNDSVYNATRSVEERMSVKVEMREEKFNYPATPWSTLIQELVMAGDDTYGLVYGYPLTATATSGEKYFHNFIGAKYIDLEKPWWNKDQTAVYPTDNVLLYLRGAFTVGELRHAFVIFFNQDSLTNHNIKDNLYDLVNEGKWTLDKLDEFASVGYNDVNGDGTRDIGDEYGLTAGDTNKYRGIPAVCNEPMFKKNADGSFTFNMNSERMTNIVEKFHALTTAPYYLHAVGNQENAQSVFSFGGNYMSKPFTEGRAMFTWDLTGNAQYMQTLCDFSIGMVPFPKFDENQDGYYTSVQRHEHIYVPVSVKDFDRSCAIIEAYCSQYYRSVHPAYFENCLKARYSSDNAMSQMFDLVRDGMIEQMGETFSSNFKKNVDTFKSIETLTTWASDMASVAEAAQAAADELVERLRTLE